MTADRTTHALLAVIALALVVIALRGLSPVPPAYAAETMSCRIEGPIQIRDEVKVKIESWGSPGYSSGSPLYVKSVQ